MTPTSSGPSLLQLLLGTSPVQGAVPVPVTPPPPFAPVLEQALSETDRVRLATELGWTAETPIEAELADQPPSAEAYARLLEDIVGLESMAPRPEATEAGPKPTVAPAVPLPWAPLPANVGTESLVLRDETGTPEVSGEEITEQLLERVAADLAQTGTEVGSRTESTPAAAAELATRPPLAASVRPAPTAVSGTPATLPGVNPAVTITPASEVANQLDLQAARAPQDLGRIAALEPMNSADPAATATAPGTSPTPSVSPGRSRPIGERPVETPNVASRTPLESPLAPAATAVSRALPEPMLPSATLQAEILAKVAETVESTARDALLSSTGDAKATFQVDPPRFGELQIQVRLDADQRAHVTISAAEDAAFEMLEGEADDLVESLLSQRLDLAELNLSGSGVERSAFSARTATPTAPWEREPAREDREESTGQHRPRNRGRSSHQGDVDVQA